MSRELEELFGRGRARYEEDEGEKNHPSPEELLRIAKTLVKDHTFQVNDLVQWKPGLKNSEVPEYGEAMVITRILPEPFADHREPHSNGYWDDCDVVVGVIVGGRKKVFGEYGMDSRRLMPLPRLPAPK